MSKYQCTGCEDFTVESDKLPQRPCPNCGYLGDGKYGGAADQYEIVD